MEKINGNDRDSYPTKDRRQTGRLETVQEWSNFMKTLSTWNFKPMVSKMTVGLVLATLFGGLSVAPAFARDGDRGWHDRGRREYRGRGYDHRRHYYQPNYYRERVYAPPPVIYAPSPPPGIGIFLPPVYLRF
jgi:hypothetical protein